jgi:hypothetical protein
VHVVRSPVEPAETVFQALDGRDVTVLGHRWRLEVFSVLELAGRRYVQLSVNGPARYMLTLRMRLDTEARYAIRTLLPWLTRPAGSGEVLDVDTSEPSPEGRQTAE